jgi:carbonic anhydrase
MTPENQRLQEAKEALEAARPRTPQEALQRLIDGNQRFAQGKGRHGTISDEAFARLRDGQQPFAIILGCSDSRVPVELVFDQSFGDLFVIRLAGNIIAPGVGGSMQYAHRNLGTSLLVVLGHEGCGAVQATLAAKFHRAEHPELIQQLVDMIEPGLEGIDPEQPAAEQLAAAVEANVRWSMHQVTNTPEVQNALREGRNILLVGAVYELSTGKVRWLDSGRQG